MHENIRFSKKQKVDLKKKMVRIRLWLEHLFFILFSKEITTSASSYTIISVQFTCNLAPNQNFVVPECWETSHVFQSGPFGSVLTRDIFYLE